MQRKIYMNLDNLRRRLVENEGECFQQLQALRALKLNEALGEVQHHGRPVKWAVEVAQGIFQALGGVETLCEHSEPGHGVGHIARDWINALRLMHNGPFDELSHADIFVGFLGGVLHDIGCALIPRYAEATRAVRHAEAGALILRELHFGNLSGLGDTEIDLVCLAVAGHTHYLRSQTVVCADGVTRTVEPWLDMIGDKPFYPAWLTRWVDRLDCNGPAFVARHFLTLGEEHDDFDGVSHYGIVFEGHMRPIVRSPEQIRAEGGKRTMLEHLSLFAGSQTNDSPYGRWDSPKMVSMRDPLTQALNRIIASVLQPKAVRVEEVLERWWRFSSVIIEPSAVGRRAVEVLRKKFQDLSADTQSAWASGFATTMHEYSVWAESDLFGCFYTPEHYFQLPGFPGGDVRSILNPFH